VERITLVTADPDWLEALVEGDEVFTSRFHVHVEPGWAGFPEALPHTAAEARRSPHDPWGTHLILGADGSLIGLGGYKGPPADGRVEIGYAVAPARRGRGIATAAVEELVRRARDRDVRTVVAHTLAEDNPSTSVLRRSGFTLTAEVHDPEDGPIWRWELPLVAGDASPG